MKPKTTITAALLVTAIGISAITPVQAQMPQAEHPGKMMQDKGGQPGQNMMDQMMSHMMGQHGMMGSGMMGSGMMGLNSGFRRDKPLSNDDVRRAVDGKLAMSGLSRLKAGAVKDEDEDAAKVDVVTQKGDLIFRLKIDRATGRTAIVE